MADCQLASLCFHTPEYRERLVDVNPYEDMPQTPRPNNRSMSSLTSKRLLADLDCLAVPSLSKQGLHKKRKPLTFRLGSSFPLPEDAPPAPISRDVMDAALRRMRAGGALQRLKEQRDAHDEHVSYGSSSQESAKQPLSSRVALGHKMPRRNSGVALSA